MTTGKNRLKRSKNGTNRWIASELTKNGTASPSEYAASIRIPVDAVCETEANVRMDPRIGPIQGVQPAANVMPTSTAPR